MLLSPISALKPDGFNLPIALPAQDMDLPNCPKLGMAAEELNDACITVKLDASGFPELGISQGDFVLLCEHTRRLDNSQERHSFDWGGSNWNVLLFPILIYPFAVARLISPEGAILIFQSTGRHLLCHEAPRLNFQQFAVALLFVIKAASLTPQGFVECFELRANSS
eukprot:gene12097-15207_t